MLSCFQNWFFYLIWTYQRKPTRETQFSVPNKFPIFNIKKKESEKLLFLRKVIVPLFLSLSLSRGEMAKRTAEYLQKSLLVIRANLMLFFSKSETLSIGRRAITKKVQ